MFEEDNAIPKGLEGVAHCGFSNVFVSTIRECRSRFIWVSSELSTVSEVSIAKIRHTHRSKQMVARISNCGEIETPIFVGALKQ